MRRRGLIGIFIGPVVLAVTCRLEQARVDPGEATPADVTPNAG